MQFDSNRVWFLTAIISGVFLIVVAFFVFFMIRGSYEPDKKNEIPTQSQDTQVEQIAENPTQEIKALEKVSKEEVKIPQLQKVRLIAVGDMMLDRSVYLHTLAAKDFYFPFENIGEFLMDADITVGNLEGSITTNTSIANGKGGDRFYFTFSPKFIEPLKQYFDVVSLANNHTLNFRQEGLDQCRDFLTQANIAYFGSPTNSSDELSVTLEKNGVTFAFVGFHELVNYGFEDIVEEIKRLRNSVDVIIAYPHWGNEYVTTNPTKIQINEAHALIDAGADSIIGTHPHVIEPIEIYKDKIIFYSLGNFIFDQYFSEETQQGLVIDMNIEKIEKQVTIDYTLVPIRISEKSQPFLASSIEAEKILDTIATNSAVSSTVQDMIRDGYITSK